jgi:hypothetical protein
MPAEHLLFRANASSSPAFAVPAQQRALTQQRGPTQQRHVKVGLDKGWLAAAKGDRGVQLAFF